MSEKVIVRMNINYEVSIWAVNPNEPNDENFEPINQIYELTPYGMMLASLADCTGQVVITYARHHHANLEEIEVKAEYKRVFKDDCESCEGIDRYDESIQESIRFHGDLTTEQREKLLKIAQQCSIHKMYEQGIKIRSKLVENIEA